MTQIRSGKFRGFVDFFNYPMKCNIAFNDEVVFRLSIAELKELRAVTKKLIQKAEQRAPYEEEKETYHQDPLYRAKITHGG